VRSVLVALLALLVAPAAAQAAPGLTLKVVTPEVRFGEAHHLNGVLADGFTVFGGQSVVLEGQRFPYTGGFHELAHTVTDARGAFHFAPKLDRNYKLRVSAPTLGATSPYVRAYTFPAITLTFRALRPGFVRLIQRYSVPLGVRLTAPTLFYLGPRGARRSSMRARGETRRLRAGRFRGRATVRLPARWHGRFRFASCFHTSPRTGMGKPDAACPKRIRF
jgi:hypothetical protein